MTIIGITGGTGAGKTTALSVLAGLGALIIDCDEIYHELTRENEEMKVELGMRFPGVIINGALDRKLLGERVFSDAKALTDLNAITHRYVGREVKKLLDDWSDKGGTLAAVDAIALIESGRGRICDFTVAVIAPAEKRAERIMAREGISRQYAMLRIQAQKSDEYYRRNCDYVLVNDCDTAEDFKEKCGGFFAGILGGKDNG